VAPERPQATPAADRPTFVQRTPAPAAGPGNSAATASVVVGSVSLALLLLSLGSMFFVCVPASIGALVLALAARRRIEAGLTAMGQGPAQAGRIIAWIGIVAGVVAGIVWIALIASGVDVQGWLEDLRDDLERQGSDPAPDGVEV
jgi:hypothetical protein